MNANTNQEHTFLAYLASHLPLAEAALHAAEISCERVLGAPVLDKIANSLTLTSDKLSSDLNASLYTPLKHFTAQGGKRIRPILAFLGAEAVGGDPACAQSVAAAIELFQSAALIHDDIADQGKLRRGEPCLYLSEGVGSAINIGDLALTRVLELVIDDKSLETGLRLELSRLLIFMERRTLEGQALDIAWARDNRWDISEKEYLFMIKSKTAYYSAAVPLKAGAMAAVRSQGGTAGGSDTVGTHTMANLSGSDTAPGSTGAADSLFEIGICAGMAFQLADDLLNLSGDPNTQGKDYLSDLTEGKRTLPVIHALGAASSLSEAEKAELTALISSHTEDRGKLLRAVELLHRAGSIAYAQKLAYSYADTVKEKSRFLAQNETITMKSAEIICSMADYFIQRDA